MKEFDIDGFLQATEPVVDQIVIDLRFADVFDAGTIDDSGNENDEDDDERPSFLKLTVNVPPVDKRDRMGQKLFRLLRVGNELEIKAGFREYANAVLKYVCDWEGFPGEFNREKVRRFFAKCPPVAASFGRACYNGFADVYKEELKQRVIDEKN